MKTIEHKPDEIKEIVLEGIGIAVIKVTDLVIESNGKWNINISSKTEMLNFYPIRKCKDI